MLNMKEKVGKVDIKIKNFYLSSRDKVKRQAINLKVIFMIHVSDKV